MTNEHEQLTDDTNTDNRLLFKAFSYLSLVSVVALISLMFATSFIPSIIPDEYYYRAYILDDQYVGNITVDNTQYHNVLIFEVTPLIDKRTNLLNLRYCNYKYGLNLYYNVNNPISNFYTEPNTSHKLYFAKENTIRSDLITDGVIFVRWQNNILFNDYIRGVEMFGPRC